MTNRMPGVTNTSQFSRAFSEVCFITNVSNLPRRSLQAYLGTGLV